MKKRRRIGPLIFGGVLLSSGLLAENAGSIHIQELRRDNGDSVISVSENGKETARYEIGLARHHHPAVSGEDPLMKRREAFKYGAFLCFNINQYTGEADEHARAADPSLFRPDRLNVRQWISTIKGAGMDHAVLTARHTADFLLWDSRTSRRSAVNSGARADIVRQYVAECRRQNIKPGIYYCVFGNKRWNPDPNARAVILAQLHELATNYGPIPYFWIDMVAPWCWLPADLSCQEIYDSLKNINPNTVVKMNNGINDGARLHSFPMDVLNGEISLPPRGGHNPWRTVNGKKFYIPFEYEPTSQRRIQPGEDPRAAPRTFSGSTWFTYGSGKSFAPSRPLAPDFLAAQIREARKRGAGSILLSCGPDHTGLFRDEDIRQLRALRKQLGTPWAGGGMTRSGKRAFGKIGEDRP